MAGTGGRPTKADAARLGDRIVTAAAELFLRDGYAATSIESIASLAGVSKRTFYLRFNGKPAIFMAVVDVLIRDWLKGFDESLGTAQGVEDALLTVARRMLDVALTPTALALHTLLTAEAGRFPELTEALQKGGADAGLTRVVSLLRAHRPTLTVEDATLAAELFQGMTIHTPQRRAIGGGPALSEAARDRWCRASVALLLGGLPER